MAITTFNIDSVTPRGGPAGTVVSIIGSNFGITAGTIKIDPLGANVAAVPTTWTSTLIVFTLPTLPGPLLNTIVTILATKADSSDFGTTPFWVPSSPLATNGLDYQWPGFEEGTSEEDTDNPRKFQASDFNRLFDKVSAISGAPSGPASGDLAGTYPSPTLAQKGAVVGQVLNWNGTSWVPVTIVSPGGGNTAVRSYTAGVALLDAVYQKTDGTVDKANATSIATAPAIGLVAAMDSPVVGQCIVQFTGDLSGFSGLSPGKTYILSLASGALLPEDATAHVDYPDQVGNIVQELGVASSASTLLVWASRAIEEI